jgi:uncharacterized protein YndB with AHSA1/START domain
VSHDLRLERLIDGTPDEVFDAFTDGEAMKDWYQIDPDWNINVVATDLRVGGTTTITFGPTGTTYSEAMTYTVVDRPSRLAYTERFGMPDGSSWDTEITVTFEAQNGKTVMTLVQTGFPNAEQRDAHQGGWPRFLDRLVAYLAQHVSADRAR